MKKIVIFFAAIVIIAAVILFALTIFSQPKQNNLDSFAKCIKNSGAKFYGAFWCAHCQNQKNMFGSAKEYLPYVECSTSNGEGQTQVCKDNRIENYPTWVFANGASASGELSLKQLSEKTGCKLPE